MFNYQLIYDIEFYKTQTENVDKPNNYILELHSSSFLGNAYEYMRYILSREDITMEEFRKDFRQIDELRGWLYEWHDNRPADEETVDIRKQKFGDELGNLIENFAEKYSLIVHTV